MEQSEALPYYHYPKTNGDGPMALPKCISQIRFDRDKYSMHCIVGIVDG